MDRWEALARRYCAMIGRDPDIVTEGYTAWQHALDELEAAMAALATFDLDVRDRFENPVGEPAQRQRDADILPFPHHAA